MAHRKHAGRGRHTWQSRTVAASCGRKIKENAQGAATHCRSRAASPMLQEKRTRNCIIRASDTIESTPFVQSCLPPFLHLCTVPLCVTTTALLFLPLPCTDGYLYVIRRLTYLPTLALLSSSSWTRLALLISARRPAPPCRSWARPQWLRARQRHSAARAHTRLRPER